jgi:hypothetical protein
VEVDSAKVYRENTFVIDPKKVAVMTPTLDGSVCCEFVAGMILSGGLYATFAPLPGCSEINLARNIMAASFLESPYEWLVLIDADIGFSRRDFELLFEGDELAVVTEYSKKDGTGEPNQFGLGFARIHRSVFERIKNLTMSADGLDPGDIGAPMVNYFTWRGRIIDEFFPSYADSAHHWSGEDHSFWKLVKMTGIVVRVETRTLLVHYGRVGYPYFSTNAQDASDTSPEMS